jgi:hypothetical protein
MGPRPSIGSLNTVIARVENAGSSGFEKKDVAEKIFCLLTV